MHYFQTQPPPGLQVSPPSTLNLSYYPIRTVLTEWNNYVHLTSRYSKYYEYSLRDMTSRLHGNDIGELQRWRRRTRQSPHKLTTVADFIDYWMQHDDKDQWSLVLKDISYLRQQMQEYAHGLEQMLTITTSIVQLLESRRSIIEAVSVKRLTYLALVFVSMAWVASLFSMSDGFLPGEDKFWVYFAPALPLLCFILLLSALPYDRLERLLRHFLGRLYKVAHIGASAKSQDENV